MTHRAKWGSVKAFLRARQPGDWWACATNGELRTMIESARGLGMVLRHWESETVWPAVWIVSLAPPSIP